MRYIWLFRHTFRNRSRILNLCRSRRSAPQLNEYFIIHLPSFESLSSSYATNNAFVLYIQYFEALLRSASRVFDQTYRVLTFLSVSEKNKSQKDVLSCSPEAGGGGTNRRHETHGLRLGVDEPSRVLRMMAISSGEEALSMTPVELASNWSPKCSREGMIPARREHVSGVGVDARHEGETPYGNTLESYSGIIWTARLQGRGPMKL